MNPQSMPGIKSINFNSYANPMTKQPFLSEYKIQTQPLHNTQSDGMRSRNGNAEPFFQRQEMPSSKELISPPLIIQNLPLPVEQTFQVDQSRWEALLARLGENECELEKLKGVSKRVTLQLSQSNQALESQRASFTDEIKKSCDLLMENDHTVESRSKMYSDKRLTDELASQLPLVESRLKILEKEVKRDNCVTSVTGTFLGVLLLLFLYNVLEMMLYRTNHQATFT